MKGFDKPKSVHALVPTDNSGLTNFLAGRKALDRRYPEGLALMQSVDGGILQQAAKIIAARHRTP